MRADIEIAPTATTQEHKRNEDAPSATQLITAHNAVKAKPRHGRGHCFLIGAACRLRLTSKSTFVALLIFLLKDSFERRPIKVYSTYQSEERQSAYVSHAHTPCARVCL